jgi:hypothetical protein
MTSNQEPTQSELRDKRRRDLSDFIGTGLLNDGTVNPYAVNTLERYIDREIANALATQQAEHERELVEARLKGGIIGLTHLIDWTNLHNLDLEQVLSGIQHMRTSMKQQLVGEVSVEPHWYNGTATKGDNDGK